MDVGWTDTKIIAAETTGANCLAAAMEQGELVTLPAISSIATSLGSSTVSQQTLDIALGDTVEVESQLFTDAQVVEACRRFSDDHRYVGRRCESQRVFDHVDDDDVDDDDGEEEEEEDGGWRMEDEDEDDVVVDDDDDDVDVFDDGDDDDDCSHRRAITP